MLKNPNAYGLSTRVCFIDIYASFFRIKAWRYKEHGVEGEVLCADREASPLDTDPEWNFWMLIHSKYMNINFSQVSFVVEQMHVGNSFFLFSQEMESMQTKPAQFSELCRGKKKQ